MQKIFVILSVALALAAAPPYVIDILKHKTKPQRATWAIYSLLGTIGFLSSWAIASNWSLVFLGVDALASISVLLLSIKYGVGGWSQLDKYAFATAAIGAAIAIWAKQPLIAIGGNILADVAGTIPTLKKAYLHPGTETEISWILIGVGSMFGALSVGKLQADLLIWPLYLAAANLTIPLAQALGRKNK